MKIADISPSGLLVLVRRGDSFTVSADLVAEDGVTPVDLSGQAVTAYLTGRKSGAATTLAVELAANRVTLSMGAAASDALDDFSDLFVEIAPAAGAADIRITPLRGLVNAVAEADGVKSTDAGSVVALGLPAVGAGLSALSLEDGSHLRLEDGGLALLEAVAAPLPHFALLETGDRLLLEGGGALLMEA